MKNIGIYNGNWKHGWKVSEEAEPLPHLRLIEELKIALQAAEIYYLQTGRKVERVLDLKEQIRIMEALEAWQEETGEIVPSPLWRISRAWADKHLNSDDDLKYFKGGAEVVE